MKHIGKIYTDMPEKFGIPRQAGNVPELKGKIIFFPPYNVPEAFMGLEEFSHIWVLWEFSESVREEFSPTVRPPRLGGDKRKGVFATRSPFRPNSIAMSCVRLEEIRHTAENGTMLIVSGVDMKSETPILDIKPYIRYTDSHADAISGFADEFEGYSLSVSFPDELLSRIPEDKQAGIIGILSQDPRPSYQNDSNRIYGVSYIDYNIKFRVNGNRLDVVDVEAMPSPKD